MTTRPGQRAGGTVLVVVLVVVAILSVVAISEMYLARSQAGAQASYRWGQQARAAAMSGICRAMSALTSEAELAQDVLDNPVLFQAQRVSDDEDGQPWYFTVYAENAADPGAHRYGVEDEAGKLNLNFAPPGALAALPGMTAERVDCLLDFLDGDSDVRDQGAEQEYYDALPRPYVINNSPLRTLETLLLVKGFDAMTVLGEDANRNGLLEPNEDDSDESFPPDDGNGELNLGLTRLATVLTYEPDVDNEGNPRINIAAPDMVSYQRNLQNAGLDPQTVEFLVRAAENRIPFTDPSQLLGMTIEVPAGGSGPKPPRPPRPPRPPSAPGGQMQQLSSGVTAANLSVVMDKLSCTPPVAGGNRPGGGQAYRVGRVNLNSAPKEVLAALPGLSETAAQQIVDLRETLDAEERSTTAWVYAQGVVSAEEFKQAAMCLTARSYQYRVRSFGYSPTCGRFCVLEAVVDLASGRPEIVYLRDLTRLGPPLAPLGEER
ncbi:MAG TPA: type II secretion system protein GspK [Phycisphaerae bacterium]|nr:type II secretion system protein GspK [Phycisphaerae bacterium]